MTPDIEFRRYPNRSNVRVVIVDGKVVGTIKRRFGNPWLISIEGFRPGDNGVNPLFPPKGYVSPYTHKTIDDARAAVVAHVNSIGSRRS